MGAVSEDETASDPLKLEDLALLVRTFTRDFSAVVERTSNSIVAEYDDPGIQRRAMVWKMRIIPLAQSYLVVDDPRIAFVDLWSLTEQIRLGATTDETLTEFGPNARILEEDMAQLKNQIRRIGGTFLTETQVIETEASIDAFAEESEIGERFFAYHRADPDAVLGSFLTGMVSTPLSALNPFSGVSETAVAIHDVAGSADLIRDVVVNTPGELRWQSELVIHDFRNSPELQRTLASLENVAKTTAEFAVIARELPQQVRLEVEALLNEVGEAQVQLNATLEQVQTTLQEVEPLLVSSERVTVSIAEAGAALEKTFMALDTTMVTILGTPEARAAAAARRDPNEESEPFRILDYAETAEVATSTAVELRALLEELQEITDGERAQELVDLANRTTATVVDHLALRIGQLILAATACALLLRFLWGRLGSSAKS